MGIRPVFVREGTISEAVEISRQIPEFQDPYGAEEYEKRFADVQYLIAIAEVDGIPVGFKAGYNREDNQSFYSWMGAVLPKHRKSGLAKALADFQEEWARNHGFSSIKMKTRNRLKPMLHFALGNGFNIIRVDPNKDVEENRIWLEKRL